MTTTELFFHTAAAPTIVASPEPEIYYGQLPLNFLPGNFAAGHSWLAYPYQGTFAVGYDLIDVKEEPEFVAWDWPKNDDTDN